MEYALKRLAPANLEAAIACRDVLDVDGANQAAWKLLGLSITDRFSSREAGLLEEAVAAFEHLDDQYERVYHVGVAWERAAKAHLERNEPHSAVTAFERALALFEAAEHMRPESPDPVLRWNRCVRLLSTHASLREALRRPRENEVRFGD
jgi:hypothetical protein